MSKIIKNEIKKQHGLYLIEVKQEAFQVKGSSYSEKLRNAVKNFITVQKDAPAKIGRGL